MSANTTILKDEIEKFTAIADQWWDPDGKFKPLHLFNPIRIEYIKDRIFNHFNKDNLKDIKILDLGCGGGLLSEPMARLGANVTGIDAAERNIKIASLHAKSSDLEIEYINITAEELANKQPESFDVILNMEVIEHVASPELLIKSCEELLKHNGLLFIATLNRTFKSYLLAIMGAEYILRWLPVGTHDWNKFLLPKEIESMTNKFSLKHEHWQGVSYNPLTKKWSYSNDLNVNYMGYFSK